MKLHIFLVGMMLFGMIGSQHARADLSPLGVEDFGITTKYAKEGDLQFRHPPEKAHLRPMELVVVGKSTDDSIADVVDSLFVGSLIKAHSSYYEKNKQWKPELPVEFLAVVEMRIEDVRIWGGVQGDYNSVPPDSQSLSVHEDAVLSRLVIEVEVLRGIGILGPEVLIGRNTVFTNFFVSPDTRIVGGPKDPWMHSGDRVIAVLSADESLYFGNYSSCNGAWLLIDPDAEDAQMDAVWNTINLEADSYRKWFQ